jgi:hypothetical protein
VEAVAPVNVQFTLEDSGIYFDEVGSLCVWATRMAEGFRGQDREEAVNAGRCSRRLSCRLVMVSLARRCILMAELDLDQSGQPALNVIETEANTIRWLQPFSRCFT